MKNLKKLFSFVLLNLMVVAIATAAPINSKEGYKNLKWGSTVEDAKKAGYKLKDMSNDKSYQDLLSNMYSEKVVGYNLENHDKDVTEVHLHYYMGKLFCVIEVMPFASFNEKTLSKRYGKFSERGIYSIVGNYTDYKYGPDSKVSFGSIIISTSHNLTMSSICDWNVYKNISVTGQALSGAKKSIVNQFDELASKLIQKKSDGSKPSFAFVPLSSEYGDKNVENYITDALSEAVFNTKTVKIIERANLEAILKEQKFQSSGLVNEETAKSIGMLAGVDFVCYGSFKDTGDEINVNARVVDVETGEICAMSRAIITKDDYLKQSISTSSSSTKAKTANSPKRKSVQNNLWKVSSYRNDFDGFTSYTFYVESTEKEMFVVEYRKHDIQSNSRVFAGVHWWSEAAWNSSYRGTVEFKLDNGTIISKYLDSSWKNYTDLSKSEYNTCTWIEKAGARWLIDIFTQNQMITARKNNVVRKFQTAGLLDKMEEVGVTWDEVTAAMANEEF